MRIGSGVGCFTGGGVRRETLSMFSVFSFPMLARVRSGVLGHASLGSGGVTAHRVFSFSVILSMFNARFGGVNAGSGDFSLGHMVLSMFSFSVRRRRSRVLGHASLRGSGVAGRVLSMFSFSVVRRRIARGRVHVTLSEMLGHSLFTVFSFSVVRRRSGVARHAGFTFARVR